MQTEHIYATTTETWGFSALASEVPNAVGIGNVYLGTVPYRSGSASSGQSRVAAELKFGVVSIGRLSGSILLSKVPGNVALDTVAWWWW